MDSQSTKKCANCEENEATKRWTGDGGTLALSHGLYSWWCERCCVQLQLKHAEERAAAIPELQQRLADLGGPFGG